MESKRDDNSNIYSNYNQTYDIYTTNTPNSNNITTNANNYINQNTLEYELRNNLEKYYIKLAKETTDLVPKKLVSQVKIYNSIHITTGVGCLFYNLYYFINFYPDHHLTPTHFSKIKYISVLCLFGYVSSYYLRQETYKRAYNQLRNEYSEEEIRNLIRKFYHLNSLSAQEVITSTIQKNQNNHI